MKALVIGAGQGRRLLPLTEIEPKALLNVGGKSLLAWQAEALVDCGVDEIVFLAGFNLPAVERALKHFAARWPQTDFRAVYNPFYGVADNLATCWMARQEMDSDFLLLNSDTLFSQPVLQTLLSSPSAPISLAVDHKAKYDDDDMKVELQGARLLDIGKTLPPERVQGESIGMLFFRGEGPQRFVAALEAAMLEPRAIRQWYLSVIAALASEIEIQAVTISGHDWCEIDYPVDLQTARRMVASWRRKPDDTLISVMSS
ncbi:phosphocholine cytidylyltransferase family protein [Pelagibius litoralis]|uniref:Phosphocholine cytidylyltransferase family protein n=1 Tax=Pelagibius litoralis TaxID=374515 RepID=A0A967F1Q6_9PROT|nr:phosphocholine cytidylyltransferase family protein [Pelagibius litoralis]NIA71499.1 phosphocholine cytidylyltransferase family protein [Pelagibius litoralis]